MMLSIVVAHESHGLSFPGTGDVPASAVPSTYPSELELRMMGMSLVKLGGDEIRVRESGEEVLRRCAQADTGISIAGMRVSPPGWINLTNAETDLVGTDHMYVQVSGIAWVRDEK